MHISCHLFLHGTPEGTRTPDDLLRRQMLFHWATSASYLAGIAGLEPATALLRRQVLFHWAIPLSGGGWGIRTPKSPFGPHGLADRCIPSYANPPYNIILYCVSGGFQLKNLRFFQRLETVILFAIPWPKAKRLSFTEMTIWPWPELWMISISEPIWSPIDTNLVRIHLPQFKLSNFTWSPFLASDSNIVHLEGLAFARMSPGQVFDNRLKPVL